MKKYVFFIFWCSLLGACNWFEVRKTAEDTAAVADTVMTMDSGTALRDTALGVDSVPQRRQPVQDGTRNRDTFLLPPSKTINTGAVQPEAVVQFAQSLAGTPYVYASTDPEVGFDCSGFITYVFNHFKIPVPRSSIDFTHVGKTVAAGEAKRGDLILFTGTDSTEKHVGHMGLITSNDGGELQFIHSTSGKAMGVTITPFNAYYKKRFVRIARIFPQNES